MKLTIAFGLLSSAFVIGACSSEPLFGVDRPDATDPPAPVDFDEDDDLPPPPNDDDDDETPPPADDDDNGDNTPNGLVCEDGSPGSSWRDTLPNAPAPVDPGATLAGSSGVAQANCGNIIVTDAAFTEFPESAHTHVGGRWYFEARVEQFEPGWSRIGVFAPPADVFNMDAFFMDEISAAGTTIDGVGTVSVAVDLEAGHAFFYADGVLRSESTISLLPGIGAFRAGGVSMSGNRIRFNFGAQPFDFGVPPGYLAWSAGCAADADPTSTQAPITVACGDEDECASDTFLASTSAATELIVLGVYDSGSVGSWEWGFDENGNPVEVETGPGENGDMRIQIRRAARIALVLSAYEPTDWVVELGPQAELASVSVFGMHLQSVTGVPDGVPVEIRTICGDGDGGNCDTVTGDNFPIAPHAWPFDTGGGDTQGFVRFIEEELCLPLKMFGGSYEARGFFVE